MRWFVKYLGFGSYAVACFACGSSEPSLEPVAQQVQPIVGGVVDTPQENDAVVMIYAGTSIFGGGLCTGVVVAALRRRRPTPTPCPLPCHGSGEVVGGGGGGGAGPGAAGRARGGPRGRAPGRAGAVLAGLPITGGWSQDLSALLKTGDRVRIDPAKRTVTLLQPQA